MARPASDGDRAHAYALTVQQFELFQEFMALSDGAGTDEEMLRVTAEVARLERLKHPQFQTLALLNAEHTASGGKGSFVLSR